MLAIEIYRFDVIQETSDILTNIHTEGRRRFTRVSAYSVIFVKKLYIAMDTKCRCRLSRRFSFSGGWNVGL